MVLFPRDAAPATHDAILATCHALGFIPREVLAAAGNDFAASLVLTANAIALVEEPAAAPEGTTLAPARRPPARGRRAPSRGGSATTARSSAWSRELLQAVLVESAGWAVARAACRSRSRPADALLT